MPSKPQKGDFLERHPDVEPAELEALLSSGSTQSRVREILIGAAALCAGLLAAGGLAWHLTTTAVEVAPEVAREVVSERVAVARSEVNAHVETFRNLAREGVELVGGILDQRLALDEARRDAGVVRSRFRSLARDLQALDLMALISDGGPRMVELIEAATRVLARLMAVIDDLEVLTPLGSGVSADLSELGDNVAPDRTAVALRDAVAKLAAGSPYALAWDDFATRVEAAWNDLVVWGARARGELEDPSAITAEIGERLPAAVLDRAF